MVVCLGFMSTTCVQLLLLMLLLLWEGYAFESEVNVNGLGINSEHIEYYSDPNDWPHIESFDGAGEDIRHPEPMKAIVDGEISCVIVRNVLTATDCERILYRLRDKELLKGGLPGKEAMKYAWARRNTQTDIGVSLHGPSIETWKATAAAQNELFKSLFIDLPINPLIKFRRVLDRLARGSGKRMSVPEDMLDGQRGTDAIIRSHHPGPKTAYAPHFDGFQQGPYTFTDFSRHYWVMRDAPVYNSHSTLSAILVLQDEEEGTDGACTLQSRIYNASLDELVISRTEDGSPVYYVTGASHWIGVHFNNELIYNFFEKRDVKSHTPRMRRGDMYVFSASRVHETFPILGSRNRINMATFMAWSDNEDEVYMFQ